MHPEPIPCDGAAERIPKRPSRDPEDARSSRVQVDHRGQSFARGLLQLCIVPATTMTNHYHVPRNRPVRPYKDSPLSYLRQNPVSTNITLPMVHRRVAASPHWEPAPRYASLLLLAAHSSWRTAARASWSRFARSFASLASSNDLFLGFGAMKTSSMSSSDSCLVSTTNQ